MDDQPDQPGKSGSRDLVEHGLEEMKVILINNCDLKSLFPQGFRGLQAAETSSHNDDMWNG